MEKMIRKRKKLTFIVIPDANQPVLQTRISRRVLVGSAIGVLSIVTLTALFLISTRNNYISRIDLLHERVISDRRQAAAESAENVETIEILHNELLNLTDKADAVRRKLNELEKLEQEIRRLSNLSIVDGMSQAGNRDASAEGSEAWGGAYDSPERIAWLPFMEDIHSRYADLYSDMDQWSERMNLVKASLQQAERILRFTPTLWPADSRQITSGFGIRRDPFTRRAAFHNGIDIEGDQGDPVFSTAGGKVVNQGWDKAFGNYIMIEHTKDVRTVYMHLHKILINQGDTVKKGQQIGQIGSTGRSTGPHLHYEVHKNGKAVNPKPYLKPKRKGKDES
jgi:murein DD-endopeptidase MepM/ murein hydrolase activator NlpD